MKMNIGENESTKLIVYESVMYLLMANKSMLKMHSLSIANARLNRLICQIKQVDRTLYSTIKTSEVTYFQTKDELIEALLPVSAALLKHANSINNQELKSMSVCSRQFLLQLTERELFEISLALRTAASVNIARLRKYKVTIQMLQNLSKRIDEFRSAVLGKLDAMLSINTYLAIKELYCEADRILDQIDGFVEDLDDEYQDFYEKYLQTRETVDKQMIET